MLFYTLAFAVFLAFTIALVASVRNATGRKVILLAASYTFYGWWSVPLLAPLLFTTFLAYFPVLVAGPILRAKQFLPQLQRRVELQFSPSILFLFLRGLAKKVLVADNLGSLIGIVFAKPHLWPSTVIWIATIAFAIQIYCDFSGYSDMARALARLFGFEIPLNFDHPYAAKNPREFWHRWHISLSTWLRDYLYIPLGGNRRYRIRNLMITMVLGGLWHGASWNFVLWGAMHGVLLIISKHMPRILFYYCLLLTWIAFRVHDFRAMFIAMKKFVVFDFDFSLAHRGLTGLYFITSVALIALFFAMPRNLDERLSRAPLAVQAVACAIIGAAFVLFWPNTSAPFIYFQF